MELESFLDRWYEIKPIDFIKKTKLNMLEMEVGISNFTGNLKKNINSCKEYYESASINNKTTHYFYSLKKDIYFKEEFFFFDYISDIVSNIQEKLPHIIIGFKNHDYKIKNASDFLKIQEKEIVHVFIGELKKFSKNGKFKIHMFSEETISDEDIQTLYNIYYVVYNNFLTKMKNIDLNKEPIYSYIFSVDDKSSNKNDFSISLNFYKDYAEYSFDKNITFDLKGFENIDLLNYNKDVNEFSIDISQFEHVSDNLYYTSQKLKENFIEFIFKNLDIDLFNLDTGNDLTISNSSELNKHLINSGSISIDTFLEIKNFLQDDNIFSQVLLKSIDKQTP